MDSKILVALTALLGLAACQAGTVTWSDSNTTYWHQTHITADNTPDVLRAQDFLEKDLAACSYEVRARNHWARNNDPVSTPDGQVVDAKGTAREDTPLPTTYELWQCMDGKGWVKLKHYYTVPY